MPRLLDGDLVHWPMRITIRTSIEEAVRALARSEVRSAGVMIGVLLTEAVTARSSGVEA